MLSSITTYKDWLPGVAGTQPRLGPVLGGRLRKGGLAPAPFLFSSALLSLDPMPLPQVLENAAGFLCPVQNKA